MEDPRTPDRDAEPRRLPRTGELQDLEALRERLDTFTGVFPDPDHLIELERLVPGSVERLIRQLELEQLYRHEQRDALLRAQRWEVQSQRLGMASAFIVATLLVGVSIYLISRGFETEGVVIVALQVVATSGIFLSGRLRRTGDEQ